MQTTQQFADLTRTADYRSSRVRQGESLSQPAASTQRKARLHHEDEISLASVIANVTWCVGLGAVVFGMMAMFVSRLAGAFSMEIHWPFFG